MLFPKIIGQYQAQRILTALYKHQHFPPLLFVGPKGVGKRTTAINFAQIINCPTPEDLDQNQCLRCQQIANLSHPEIKILFPIAPVSQSEDDKDSQKGLERIFREIEENLSLYTLEKMRPNLPANYTISIQIMRWLKQEMAYKPMVGKYRVVIILNADKMTNEAANAFLKTLEEPQQQTLFILTTERLSYIIPTIRSRCQIVRFTPIAKDLIAQYLVRTKNIPLSEAETCAEISEGSLRKALEFYADPTQFLPQDNLLRLVDTSQSSFEELILEVINKNLEDFDTEIFLKALLFLYRKALQLKLNLSNIYAHEVVKKIAQQLSIKEIINRISFILNRLQDAELYLNKRLYLFSVVNSLRF
ncbi:MAG: hypothetical protein N2201_06675 [candidate division WOR-3 bacterium]|nr:hypothetical protein [candidate division WOR-3 bacterium]